MSCVEVRLSAENQSHIELVALTHKVKMCKHNSLKQYYWVDDFDGKELTLPAAGVPFIQTEFLENVSK